MVPVYSQSADVVIEASAGGSQLVSRAVMPPKDVRPKDGVTNWLYQVTLAAPSRQPLRLAFSSGKVSQHELDGTVGIAGVFIQKRR